MKDFISKYIDKHATIAVLSVFSIVLLIYYLWSYIYRPNGNWIIQKPDFQEIFTITFALIASILALSNYLLNKRRHHEAISLDQKKFYQDKIIKEHAKGVEDISLLKGTLVIPSGQIHFFASKAFYGFKEDIKFPSASFQNYGTFQNVHNLLSHKNNKELRKVAEMIELKYPKLYDFLYGLYKIDDDPLIYYKARLHLIIWIFRSMLTPLNPAKNFRLNVV